MNTLVLLLISIAVLFCGYVFYGSWIARQWGVNEGNRPTPAHTMDCLLYTSDAADEL